MELPVLFADQARTTVRIVITLKPGILDAAGQAVRQGLQALGYAAVGDVRVGRYLELTMPSGVDADDVRAMCERFLANPLIEEWRIDVASPAAGDGEVDVMPGPERV